MITGKTTSRNRSTSPAVSSERARDRLPRVRIERMPSRFIARTASTASVSTSRVFGQASGRVRVEEKTTFGTASSPVRLSASSGR